MRRVCLTFIGTICRHVFHFVKLAIECGLEMRVWWKHALRLSVDELVSKRSQERLLGLRFLLLAHDFAQYALSLSRSFLGHVAHDAYIVI